MSLAKRLSQVVPFQTNSGCRTCGWLKQLPAADRHAFDDWLVEGRSAAQLWEVCCSDDNPLQISLTGFRHHLKHHKRES